MEKNGRADVYNTTICHSQFSDALSQMTDLFDANCNDGIVDGLMITGPTGVGKTFLRKQFMGSHKPYDEAERTVVPVIAFSVPSNPKGKGMYQMILSAFGSNYLTGTETALEDRIIKLIKACGTRLIIADESNHLVDRGGQKSHEKAADNFKTLMNEANVSVIMLGTERVSHLLTVNDQLRRRFSTHLQLEPWKVDDDEHLNEFGGIVTAILGNPKLELEYQSLIEPGFLTRLIYACGGRISYLTKLVGEATRIAQKNAHKALVPNHFERAFKSKIWAAASVETNPFSKSFIKRQLTGLGEPYWVQP
jgi:hypothetical protein